MNRQTMNLFLWSRSLRSILGRIWKIISHILNALPKIVVVVTSMIFIAVAVVIAIALSKELTGRTIVIQSISVPKVMADNGYTPEVASQRLRVELLKIAGKPSATQLPQLLPEVTLPSESPTIVVPTVGVSIETVASFIRAFVFSDRRHTISGEFTIAGGQLWLRLRRDRQDLYRSEVGVDPANPDELLALAAEAGLFLEEEEPYYAATWRYKTKPKLALETARRNVARLPNSDPDLAGLYTLIGIIHRDQDDFPNALQAPIALSKPTQNTLSPIST
jgi:hypothetical protein